MFLETVSSYTDKIIYSDCKGKGQELLISQQNHRLMLQYIDIQYILAIRLLC